MASFDWFQCSAVESSAGKVGGAWVFKDTRMPVSIVFENLEAGAPVDEIMEWFHLSREQIVTVLEFAARSLDAFPAPSPGGPAALSEAGISLLTALFSTQSRRRHVQRVVAAVNAATPGSFAEVKIPFE
jgi:uncharacterized protein (DUF433 family)